MIVAKIEDLAAQVVMTPAMEKALAFLRESLDKDLALGRVPIDGDTVYAMVQAYNTKDTADVMFEGHRRYIDLQCVLTGREFLGWAPVERALVTRQYDEERDMWLGTVEAQDVTRVLLTGGMVAVLYPNDAHAPSRAAGISSPVRKVVVKVGVGA